MSLLALCGSRAPAQRELSGQGGIRWLTGPTEATLEAELSARTSVETFFTTAPTLNPARALITGVVCGVRPEEI